MGVGKDIHAPKDYALVRSKDPERFAKVVSEPQIDNSAVLVKKMDEYGVTHAIANSAEPNSMPKSWSGSPGVPPTRYIN